MNAPTPPSASKPQAPLRTLRYATHLGYRPPFEPLFRASVGSDDPVEHIRFAAAQGFAGVLDAGARRRAVAEQLNIGAALREHGLECGCLLYTAFDRIRHPAWSRTDAESREWIAAELVAALEVARRIGSSRLAILGGADPDPSRPLADQRATMAENLHMAANVTAAEGVMLCIETLDEARLPGMLLHHLPDALAVVREADHPGVRLIFDTGHVQAMDGDVLPWLDAAADVTAVVQLADQPGRVEPGRGTIDFAGVLRALAQRGYAGLVELEHGWAEPGRDSEARGLAVLAALDARAAGA